MNDLRVLFVVYAPSVSILVRGITTAAATPSFGSYFTQIVVQLHLE